jgi:hypothetical protein
MNVDFPTTTSIALDCVQEVTDLELSQIEPSRRSTDYGVDLVQLIGIVVLLEDRLNVERVSLTSTSKGDGGSPSRPRTPIEVVQIPWSFVAATRTLPRTIGASSVPDRGSWNPR